ncbi:MAG: type IV pilus modification protein PilV [Gammaproteobacteria bacterium]|nr:type IV pilus modification protein PilV [Gammaproteobacteria bacterium]
MLMRTHSQKGFTLIEAMIALLVISVGLLGIAALQVTSMQQNNSALHHSKAVWIAYTMADRIRANMNEFVEYDDIDTTNDYDQDCTGAPCSSNEMVISDAEEWKDAVSALPDGRGRVNGNATALTISVMWDDEGTGATGTGCGNNPDVDLTCYTVTLTR